MTMNDFAVDAQDIAAVEDSVRRFVQTEVKPHLEAWEEAGQFPRELYQRATQGNYQKGEQEDVSSIARSITSPKGAVHVAFGQSLEGPFAHADEVAAAIGRQVMSMYRMHPTNACPR